MTASTKTILAIAAAALVAFAAHAGDDKAKKMDTNGDGVVSAAEHDAGTKATFDAMDADHDGNVTATEMDTAHAAMDRSTTHGNETTSADKIKTVDTTGDGVLSSSEQSAGATATFQKMDADGNGTLTPQEMSAGEVKSEK